MNQKEFLTISAMIKSAYPNANIMPDKNAINVWYAMLKDLDYKHANIAVMDHISSNKFPPTIAEIREKATELSFAPIGEWSEAWGNVLMAIRKYGYIEEGKALESMDEITRRCVKRIGFGNICMSENITADRANFRDIYVAEAKREKERNQLSLEVRTKKEKIIENLISETTKSIENKEIKKPKKVKQLDVDQIKKLLEEVKNEI